MRAGLSSVPASLVAVILSPFFAQAVAGELSQPRKSVPKTFRNLSIGRLEIPCGLAQRKAQRAKVTLIVLNPLGKMPPGQVKIVKRDNKNHWPIGKFVFHNGVASQVPAYIGTLLLKNRYIVFDKDDYFTDKRRAPGTAGQLTRSSPLDSTKKLEHILDRSHKLSGKHESFRSINYYVETGYVYNHDQKQEIVDWFNRYPRSGPS